MSAAEPIVVRAHAKINLALAVSPPVGDDGPRRGWHEICSWMTPVSLHDTVFVQRAREGSMSLYAVQWAWDAPRPTPIDWPIVKDLAVRAHMLLERETGRSLPVRLRVDKRTPVGGGLGGGSADAAAALRATAAAFALGLPADRLGSLSALLGSDVAFFLDDADPPRPAIVEGFGDRIARTPPPAPGTPGAPGSRDAVLIFPPFGCPTPAVYKAFDALTPDDLARHSGDADFARRAERVRALAAAADLRAPLFNDLAPAAELVAPALAHLRALASRLTELPAHVTGSGSTLFHLARDADHAAWCAARLRDALADHGAAAITSAIL